MTTACTSAISTTGFSSTSGTSANPESPEATSCLAGTLVTSSSTGCSFSRRAAGSTTGSSVADSPSASFLVVSVGSSVVLQLTMIPPAIMLSRSTAFNQPGKIVPLVFILSSLVLFISCHFHPRCGPICLPVLQSTVSNENEGRPLARMPVFSLQHGKLRLPQCIDPVSTVSNPLLIKKLH